MPREIGLGKKITKDSFLGRSTSLEEKGILFVLINCYKRANKDKRLTYMLLLDSIRVGQHKEEFLKLYKKGLITINFEKELLKHVNNYKDDVYLAFAGVNELSEYSLPKGAATYRFISNILKRGYSVEDIIKVYANNIEKWWGSDWNIYLRPKTTLGNKFQTYLDEFNNYGMGKQTYILSKVKSGVVIDETIINTLEDGVKYNVIVESQEGKIKTELIKKQIQDMMNLSNRPKITFL